MSETTETTQESREIAWCCSACEDAGHILAGHFACSMPEIPEGWAISTDCGYTDGAWRAIIEPVKAVHAELRIYGCGKRFVGFRSTNCDMCGKVTLCFIVEAKPTPAQRRGGVAMCEPCIDSTFKAARAHVERRRDRN